MFLVEALKVTIVEWDRRLAFQSLLLLLLFFPSEKEEVLESSSFTSVEWEKVLGFPMISPDLDDTSVFCC